MTGADVNARGGHYSNALQTALLKGNEAMDYGNALQVASWKVNEAVV
jgi:hypothetical protein